MSYCSICKLTINHIAERRSNWTQAGVGVVEWILTHAVRKACLPEIWTAVTADIETERKHPTYSLINGRAFALLQLMGNTLTMMLDQKLTAHNDSLLQWKTSTIYSVGWWTNKVTSDLFWRLLLNDLPSMDEILVPLARSTIVGAKSILRTGA